MDKILDGYTVAFIIFLCLAILHFRQSIAMRSQGKKLLGVASFLFSIALLASKISVFVFACLTVISYILGVIAYGVLMTKEKDLYKRYWTQHGLYGRLSRFFSRKKDRDIVESEDENSSKPHESHSKAAMVTGILTIVAAVLIALWQKDIIYPILLTLSGVFFIFMGKHYSNKA